MKASLLVILGLVISSTSFAQTAPSQNSAPGLQFDSMVKNDALYGVTAQSLIQCSALILASEFIARQIDTETEIGDEGLLMQAAINTLKDDADNKGAAFSFDDTAKLAKEEMIAYMKDYVDDIVKNIEGQDGSVKAGERLESDMLACSELGAKVSAKIGKTDNGDV